MRGDRLQAGAGGSHATDSTARDYVGEAEPETIQVRRAAVRAHAEQAAADGKALEFDLVVEGDVVAEEEHVQTVAQGRHRFECGVCAGHRYEREVGVRELPERRLEGPGADSAGGLTRATLLVEERFCRCQGRFGGRLRLRVDGEHQIAGRCISGAGRGEARRREEFAVRRGAHQRGGLAHPGPLIQRCRQLHEHHGVLIEGAPDLHPDRHDPYL